jgi:hypothetical protein
MELQFQFNIFCIESNQIFEFLNFKSPNIFKFQIDIKTDKAAFLIVVKLGL